MASEITISYSRKDLENLILEDIRKKLPYETIEKAHIDIETKSKQNYRSEWETADYRATFKRTLL